ncbi:MAG: cupin-like domain-containing protein [Phycisphaeraceae bacterium]
MTIPVVHPPSAEEFRRRYVQTRTPVILAGAIQSWPALSSWTPLYLKHRVGEVIVSVETHATPIFCPNTNWNAFPCEQMMLREYIDRISAGPSDKWHYAAQVPLAETLPALLTDIRQPDFHRPQTNKIAFWVGAKGTGTHLHYDPYDNIMAVVRGTKRFVLFRPGQFGRLYPYPAFSRWGHFSQVDVNAPDLARFPRYARAEPITCVVSAGQALYLPHGWWHYVVNEDLTIAVNFFYRISFLRRLTLPMLRFRIVALYKRWSKLRSAFPARRAPAAAPTMSSECPGSLEGRRDD